jgi:hypothetical protein
MAPTRSTLPVRALSPARGWNGIFIALGTAVAAALAALVAALAMLPPALVFPVIAAALILAAAAMVLIAWGAPPETGATRTVYWDVAGLLALVGLAAALFGEPEQAVALLRREEA